MLREARRFRRSYADCVGLGPHGDRDAYGGPGRRRGIRQVVDVATIVGEDYKTDPAGEGCRSRNLRSSHHKIGNENVAEAVLSKYLCLPKGRNRDTAGATRSDLNVSDRGAQVCVQTRADFSARSFNGGMNQRNIGLQRAQIHDECRSVQFV